MEGLIAAAMPCAMACVASSADDHRATGSWLPAGVVQASALTRAPCTPVKVRGRPVRGGSSNPGKPVRANLLRDLRTVSRHMLTSVAILWLDRPAAAASTIRARSTSRCAAVADRDRGGKAPALQGGQRR